MSWNKQTRLETSRQKHGWNKVLTPHRNDSPLWWLTWLETSWRLISCFVSFIWHDGGWKFLSKNSFAERSFSENIQMSDHEPDGNRTRCELVLRPTRVVTVCFINLTRVRIQNCSACKTRSSSCFHLWTRAVSLWTCFTTNTIFTSFFFSYKNSDRICRPQSPTRFIRCCSVKHSVSLFVWLVKNSDIKISAGRRKFI